MNILIINGSPRKQGLVSQLLGIMKDEALQRGDSVEEVFSNYLTVKPCMGCMVCRSTGECVLPEDDAQRVLKQLQAADAVIMGAPCYWGNMPGTMKVLFDRWVYGLMTGFFKPQEPARIPKPLMKGKRCILVSTCSMPFPLNIWLNHSRGTIRSMREVCNNAGIKVVATVERGGTIQHPTLTKKDVQRCRKAISRLK